MGKRFDDYFLKIGEVSKQFNIEPHILRYWEKEFKSLKPRKSNSGQRIYNRDDVELVGKIRELLYERKFSIEGAKRLVDKKEGSVEKSKGFYVERKALVDVTVSVAEIKDELESILSILKGKP